MKIDLIIQENVIVQEKINHISFRISFVFEILHRIHPVEAIVESKIRPEFWINWRETGWILTQ